MPTPPGGPCLYCPRIKDCPYWVPPVREFRADRSKLCETPDPAVTGQQRRT